MGTDSLAKAAIVLIAGSLVSCNVGSGFSCASSEQCGVDGLCEPTGVCSFPDADCASGRRYGALAGALSGMCVPASGGTEIDPSTGQPPGTSSTVPPPSTTVPPPGSSSDGDSSGMLVDTTGDNVESSTGVEADASTGVVIPRVDAGILTLYEFDEGGGTVVNDASGVEPTIDLTVIGPGFDWTPQGLVNSGPDGIVLAEGSASKILDACQATNELTIEAWVTSSAPDQLGPARIVTYSTDTSNRNFTIGEGTGTVEAMSMPGYSGRVRTTDGGVNGEPFLIWEGMVATEAKHLVFTRDAAGNEIFYVDAVELVSQVKTGTFDNWDPDTDLYKLALGNETTLNRAWLGELHLVAIFDRALTQDEVTQNFDAGY